MGQKTFGPFAIKLAQSFARLALPQFFMRAGVVKYVDEAVSAHFAIRVQEIAIAGSLARQEFFALLKRTDPKGIPFGL